MSPAVLMLSVPKWPLTIGEGTKFELGVGEGRGNDESGRNQPGQACVNEFHDGLPYETSRDCRATPVGSDGQKLKNS